VERNPSRSRASRHQSVLILTFLLIGVEQYSMPVFNETHDVVIDGNKIHLPDAVNVDELTDDEIKVIHKAEQYRSFTDSEKITDLALENNHDKNESFASEVIKEHWPERYWENDTQRTTQIEENSNETTQRKLYVMCMPNGIVKIGVSVDPQNRLSGIQTGNPYSVNILATACDIDASKVEKRLHSKYDEYSMEGEWFDLPKDELVQLITDVKYEEF